MRVKALPLAGLAAAALTLVTACTPDDPATPSSSGSPAAGATSAAAAPAGAGRDRCLTGTWKVDVADLAQQTAAKVGHGATGAGTGTITLVFGPTMTIKYADVIAITSPLSAGLTMTSTNTFTGEATSTDWVAKDGRLGGTMPANTVTSKIVTTINGRESPTTTTPFSGALDMSAGQLGYTCSGNAATFSTPMVTWHLTKA
ncbi:hypothetical protein R8Z50_14000 [Longispora sp. K20-0274]|uniref:hypothetical protein n=1 Tax=Longispora sp. K20-0274 TaxID=3088255 RepID=UPI00399B41C5